MSLLPRSPRCSLALLTLCALLACLAFGGPTAWAQSTGPDYRAGEVIIKFAPEASPADVQNVLTDLGATRVTNLRSIRASQERIANFSVPDAIARYRDDRRVAFIEPNYIVRADRTPNDALFSQLWAMHNTGQTGGTPGADIRATNAWDVSTGSSSVLVAIIDTGTDYNHPDLAANIWTNPGEIPGNGIDDDGNGYVDDVHGYDFVNRDGDPMDDNGHGTHVAGTIGAIGDDSVGVAGVCWNVKIMPLKFLDTGGSGTTADAILAVQYATQMDARIMNNSWGGGGYSEALRLAIQVASDAGILFVAAAGNDAVDNDTSPHYPANYDVPLVISVASTDHYDNLSSFSCYGATTVDLGAPGSAILSTTPNNTYSTYSGTSMATPHVSGALALMLARFPSMSGADAKQMLLRSVDPLPSLAGRVLTGGRLNAFTMLAEPDSIPPAGITDVSVTTVDGSWVTLAWTATGDDGAVGRASRYDVRYSLSPITEANFDAASAAPGMPYPQPAGTPESVRVNGLAFETPYWFAVKAFDEFGNASPMSNVASGTTLPGPHGAITPDSLVADLYTGASTMRTLGIANTGASELVWHLSIQETAAPLSVAALRSVAASTWQVLGQVAPTGANRAGSSATVEAVRAAFTGMRSDERILLYSDEYGRTPGQHYADLALQALGLPYTGIYNDPSSFGAALTSGSWDFVFVNHCNYYALGQWWNELESYLLGGGRLLISTFDVDGSHSEPTTLWSSIGLAPRGDVSGISVYWWDSAHQIFNRPQSVPPLTSMNNSYLDEGDRVAAVAGAEDPAGFVPARTPDFSGIVISPSRHALVNTFIASDTYADLDADGQPDAVELFENEIQYVMRGSRWLAADTTAGVVPAGGSVQVGMTFDATDLIGGDYRADVTVASNDPDQPVVNVPAHLHVTGAPDISLSAASLAFGDVFIGLTRTDTLVVRNDGTDLLDVTGLSTDAPEFTVQPTSFQLSPGQSQTVLVRFTPPTPASFAGTLTISSNDPDEGTLTVPLSGAGLEPPDIVVTPDSLTADLFTGEKADRVLHVANRGLSDLRFQISIQNASFAARLTVRPAAGRLAARVGSGGPVWTASDRAPAGFAPVKAPASVTAGAKVLIIEDYLPWGYDSNEAILTANGIPYDVIPAAQLASTNLATYRVVIVPSVQSYTFYTTLAAQSAQIEDFVMHGGVLEFHAAGFGSEIGFVTLPGGMRATIYPSSVNYVLLPQHPIVAGVPSPFSGNYASHSYLDSIPVYAERIAADDAGHANLVTYRYGAGRVIAGGQTFEFAFANGWQGGPMLPNMILYALESAGGGWLSTNLIEGVVPAGGSADVTATFDATGLFGGDYRADVAVASNDPDQPVVNVSAHLHVTGAPDITLSRAAFAFGELFIGLTRTDTLVVRNDGTDLLDVTGIGADVPVFTAQPTSFQLQPGQSQTVLVRFTPTDPGPVAGSLTVASNDADEGTLILPLSGTGLLPPDIAVTPDSLSADLFTGQKEDRTLHVANSGGSDLNFTVGATVRALSVPVYPKLELAKGEPDPRPGILGRGGPDLFGYTWRDSDEPGGPAFNWVDITGSGSPLPLSGDDYTVTGVPIGFNFTFYGNTFSTVSVSTNGFLSFTSSSAQYWNYPLPSPGAPPNLLAVLWDDLYVPSPTVYAYHDASRFIVSYVGVPPLGGGSPQTFQVILYPNGRILYQYLTCAGTWDLSATVGIQDAAGTDGLTVEYDSAYLHDHLAVELSTMPRFLTVVPTAGTIPAGSSMDLTATFDATGLLGGDYRADVAVASNDPDEPVVNVPARLHVTGAPDISLSVGSFAFGELFIGLTRTDTLVVRNDGTDLLDVTGIGADVPVFTAQPTSFQLQPGQSQTVLVRFTPTDPGPVAGSLTVASNDADEGTLILPLSGTGLVPPDIAVTPDSLSADLLTGGQAARVINIANTGLSNLSYEISVSETGALAAPARISRRFTPAVAGVGLQAAASSRPASAPPFAAAARPLRAPLASVPSLRDLSSATSGGMRILMVNVGGDDSELHGLLAAMPDVAVVDEFDASYGVPTLDVLRQYGTTVLIVNAPLPDPVGLGNVLADFADAGGGVVLTVASFSSGYGYQVQGRLLSGGYVPFTASPDWVYDDTLGTFDPAHPIMRGVAAVSSSFAAMATLAPGAQWVASFANGTPLVATQGHHVVGVNLYFGYSGYWAGDVPELMHNAVAWAGGVRWLTTAPQQGIVPPHSSVEVTATFDATGLFGGDYRADVAVASNDPDQPVVNVSAHLHVTGAPDITLSRAAFAFGELFIGLTRTDTLVVRNDGTDLLDVTGIGADVPVFTAQPTSFQLPPGQSQTVLVRFTPTDPGPVAGSLTVASNDGDEGTLILPLSGTGLVPPDIAVTPDSLLVELYTGGREDRTLHVVNSGGSDLNFTVGATVRALSVPVYPKLELAKGEPDPRPGILGKGGPDLFGYTWRDSDEPGGPAFNWVDITGSGTPLPLSGDDYTVTGVPIGFDFTFYGNTFSTVSVSTNGFLSFTSSSAQYVNYPLPSPYAPPNLLAVLWNDLYVSPGTVYAYHDASRFIVSYVGVPRLGGGPPQTFEVILYPNGRILYQYLTCAGTWDLDATVGIQDAAGTDGLTVEYDSAYLHDHLAVELSTMPRFLTVVPTAGTIPAGSSMDLTATFDATGLLGGDYRADVAVASNDPDEPVVNVPAHLHVTGAPRIVVSPGSLDFGHLVVGQSRQDTLIVTNEGTDVLVVSSVALTNPVFTAPTAGFSLAIGEARTLLVGFAPTSEGTFDGTLTLHSNDPSQGSLIVPLHGTAATPANIVVSPRVFQEALAPNEVRTRDLVLENRGGSPLNWVINTVAGLSAAVTDHIAAQTTPPGMTPVKDPQTDPPTAPPRDPVAARLVSSQRRAAGVAASAGPGAQPAALSPLQAPRPLTEILALLTNHYLAVTNAIPNRYDFGEGEVGTHIFDGGEDMYDAGNYLGTDRDGPIAYTNLVITTSNAFAPGGGAYFAGKFPGLFVLAADLTEVTAFLVWGNLGADGMGAVDGAELEVTLSGTHYRGFVKRVYGAGVPSVNHLIIIAEPDSTTTHTFSPDTDQDYDLVLGLGTSSRMYYLLYAGQDGAYIDDAATLEIMMAFLTTVNPPLPWLSVAPAFGTVAAGSSATVSVRFDAHDLAPAQYDARLLVLSNDPDEPVVTVPTSMLVEGGPTAIEVSLASSKAESGKATLIWYAAQASIPHATVYRRTKDSDWVALGTVGADGQGYLRFEDTMVVPGQRYGYCLGFHENGRERFLAETWVDVPPATFALHGLQNNPAVGDIVVVFSLPDARAATLELLDITGRRVVSQDVGSLGLGRHSVTLGAGTHYAPGVYVVRLSQAGRSATVRAAVIR